jgi:hypothetical protein
LNLHLLKIAVFNLALIQEYASGRCINFVNWEFEGAYLGPQSEKAIKAMRH